MWLNCIDLWKNKLYNVVVLRKQIESICLEAFESRTYILESDARIAMEGALDGENGIVIIAGTGSIALALKDNLAKSSISQAKLLV